ncbi:uncharacterized protein LOC144649705 [Oculina patagonica]
MYLTKMAISSRCKRAFLLLILCLISRHVWSSEKTYPGAIFTKQNSRLKGYTFKSSVAPSQISCSQTCLSNARCYSTNFKEITHQREGLCELNDEQSMGSMALENNLYHEDGFIFARFPKEEMDDCRWRGCQNNGVCVVNKQSYVCACDIPWTGNFCQTKISLYNFTTLGASGKDGPDSNAGYAGTGLQDVKVSDGKQEWIVPFTGRFRVEACGASGGEGSNGGAAGKGAKVTGYVTLNKGDKLVVLVGQRGSSQAQSHPGSGGGGTFVVYFSGSPILVAGGGGGGATQDGFPGNDHVNGSGTNGAGSDGEGGFVCEYSDPNLLPDSGSGAGLNGNGGCFESGKSCGKGVCNKGGKSFTDGGEGGEQSNCPGGFGGGGACENFPGGGGGYSGGGVDPNTAGGGGGSFVDDVALNITKGGCNEGDGYVSFISED